MNQGTVFLEHAVKIGHGAGNVGAVLVVRQIVDAINGDLQSRYAVVHVVEQFRGGGTQGREHGFNVVEAGEINGFYNGVLWSAGSGGRAGNNSQEIVTQRAAASDRDRAVRFYRNVGVHVKINFHVGGIFGIGNPLLDAPDGRPTGVMDFRARR